MSAPGLVAGLLDFRRLDELASVDSRIHAIDARAKVVVTLVFVVCVMSYGRYAVGELLPYFVYPVLLVALARLPAAPILRKVLLVLPIALLIGLPNPLLDRGPLLTLGGLEVSGGWVSLVSIVLRALLAASACIVLVAVTGFPVICAALDRLGMPRPLTVQLLFLYRYLTVLGEEATRMIAAYELRSADRRPSLRTYGTLVGRLLLRTWDRAERIHLAMLARGYTGEFRGPSAGPSRFADLLFLLGWCVALLLLRTQDVAHSLGAWIVGSPA